MPHTTRAGRSDEPRHDDNDSELEEQPFLEYDESARRPRSRKQMFAFFIIIVITVFGLTLIPFGIEGDPNREVDMGGGHGHGGHGDMEMGGHSHDEPAHDGHTDAKPEPEHEEEHAHEDEHKDKSKARLRDLSEYVLDQAWKYDAAPTTREYKWTIENADLNPDGIYRPMILINNQYPGPLIECNEGDTISVTVENKAVNATAIHFHGMFQNGTNFMDGTVGVTQCAIAPNSSFTYKFKVDGQSGTYWYHAHHSAQSADGLLGPFIVHSKQERELQKIEYDTDRIIMVQDHYHNLTSELLMSYLKSGAENDEPVPDNALINGRGVRKCEDFPGWKCDAAPALPTLDLEKDKKHRLRFINVGAFAEFSIQFDEHSFHVTEVDGTDIHPAEFHRLNILPGQRYSVILQRNEAASTDSIWMRSRMVTHCFTTENKRLVAELRATVRFIDADNKPVEPAPQPTSKEWPEGVEVICKDLNITTLHPVIEQNPPPPTDSITLHAAFHIGDWRLARGTFNSYSWIMNATHPSLYRFLDSDADPALTTSQAKPFEQNKKVFDEKKEYVMQANGIRTVDLYVNNYDDGSHPFHLHGHKFWVLEIGESGYPPKPEDLDKYLKDHELGKNPLRRDTVTIEGYGWAVIRVVLDNPGMWAFHCHNAWHAEAGMLMQFMVRPDEMRRRGVSDELRGLCAAEGVTTGMRPDDALWFGNFDD